MSMADEMREHLQNHIVPFWQKLEDKEDMHIIFQILVFV